MSSSKRDFTDFSKFPGKLINNVHEFPQINHTDGANRLRKWLIFVRLVYKNQSLQNTIDWDTTVEKTADINLLYYTLGEKIPENIIAQVWTESGITSGKITRSQPSYFSDKSNEGRANERNVFQQALIVARNLYIKRTEKSDAPVNNTSQTNSMHKMYFPMLAKSYEDGIKHIKFPCYIQPKLDGIRCLSYLSKYKNSTYNDVICYSRNKKIFPSLDYLREILYPYLYDLYDVEKKQSIYLDGELYKHGKKLQDISGDSRNETANTTDNNKNRNQYFIYDCFYPSELDMTFSKRYKQLKVLYDALPVKSKVIKPVATYVVKSLEEANAKYKAFTKLYYEGAILRNADGPYLGNAEKTGAFLRSNNLVKLKPKFTDEFRVIDFTDGIRGKDKNAIIWICETKKHIVFNVTPKDCTYKQRYELYESAKANFNKLYKGKDLTIEYEDLSADGVPLRAKALTFRDYE